MEHTRGPWLVKWRYNIASQEREIAMCAGYMSGPDWKKTALENEANARLIAAAPDLLEACKQATYMYESSGLTGNVFAYKMLCAAIAKAEGRE